MNITSVDDALRRTESLLRIAMRLEHDGSKGSTPAELQKACARVLELALLLEKASEMRSRFAEVTK